MHTRSLIAALSGAGGVMLGVSGALAAPANAATAHSAAAPTSARHHGELRKEMKKGAVIAQKLSPAERKIEKSRRQEREASMKPDSSIGLGLGCTGFWSAPFGGGGYIFASAGIYCGAKHYMGALTDLQKLRWYGWQNLGSASDTRTSYSVYAIKSNYCKGAGTYSYMNSFSVAVRGGSSFSGSPIRRGFNC